MSLFWTIVILVAVNAATIGAMLLVRRRAPEGSYFKDGDRASGVFGVLAGGFAIFAGFIIFLAFTTYDQSRSGGEAEALTVIQQFETAELLPARGARPADRARSSATDARSCTRSGRRWRQGKGGDTINPWAIALFRSLQLANPKTATEQAAYGEVARSDLGPRGGPARSAPRRGGHHPDLDLARPLPDRAASSSPSCCSSRTAARACAPRRC